ncbi:beta-galactosidase 11-like [Magnolia sinica]|uniref:beta-galactosidase 11-like n=1 Tax=Magnolia sinica TaxID=86752 RepID=UPI002658F0FA|nr:beta-galactosidase 11-like [Magnolia sinica]
MFLSLLHSLQFIYSYSGFQKEPKWRHLRDLHSALRLCGKALLWVLPTVYTMGKDIEVTSQHNARGYHLVKESHKDKEWKMHQEKIPTISDTYIRSMALLELMNLTKDRTDYLWYILRALLNVRCILNIIFVSGLNLVSTMEALLFLFSIWKLYLYLQNYVSWIRAVS